MHVCRNVVCLRPVKKTYFHIFSLFTDSRVNETADFFLLLSLCAAANPSSFVAQLRIHTCIQRVFCFLRDQSVNRIELFIMYADMGSQTAFCNAAEKSILS